MSGIREYKMKWTWGSIACAVFITTGLVVAVSFIIVAIRPNYEENEEVIDNGD